MPYKYLELEFDTVENLFHLEVPINVFSVFVQSLGENIEGSSFNKYYEPPRNPHPRISLRFNFKGEREEIVNRIALGIARDLRNTGRIRYHDNDLRDWTEPDFVVKAHELGSAWAIDLKEWMVQNQDVYQHFSTSSDKKSGFMAQLVRLLFKFAGFDVPFVWGFLRLSPTYNKDELKDEERVLELARRMAMKLDEKIREVDEAEIPDFLDRAVHALFNCSLTIIDVSLNTESRVLEWLDCSLRWKRVHFSFLAKRSLAGEPTR